MHYAEMSAAAPDVVFDGRLSLDALVQYAVSSNPQIAAARNKMLATAARAPQARSLDDPQLVTLVFLNAIETAAGPYDAQLSLQQKIPWFGKRALRGSVEEHRAWAARAELAAVELRVVEQVKRAYFELYYLDQAIEVNRSLEPRLKDVIEIARTRFETGNNVGLESVLQAEVELYELRTTLTELDQAKVRARAALARQLHLPIAAVSGQAVEVPGTPVPLDAELLVAMLEACQPELAARRHEIAAGQDQIALARKNYYPDPTLGVSWYAIGSSGLSPIATGDDAVSLTIGANLPIYRQRLDAGVREARYNTANAVRRFEATWDEARAEIQSLHATVIEQDRVLQLLDRDILPKAQQTLELSIEAYRLGRIGFQQLIDNYESLLRLRIERYRRLANRAQAVASLDRAIGCAVNNWSGEGTSGTNSGSPEEVPPPAMLGR